MNSLKEIGGMILIAKLHNMKLDQRCTNINKKFENTRTVTKERNLVLRDNGRVH